MSNIKEQTKYKPITWTEKNALEFRQLALLHIDRLEKLISEGYFDDNTKNCVTTDMEQEVMAINLTNGKPYDIEEVLDTHPLARPDTTNYFCEFDAGSVICVKTAKDIYELESKFRERRSSIADAVIKLSDGKADIFSIGSLPFKFDTTTLLLKDKTKQLRYALMDEMTYGRENESKQLRIENRKTKEVFNDRASNLVSMSRCASTQPHFGFTTQEKTLKAYNISIAITPLLVSLFSNSAFVNGIDSGLVCSRLELLRQSEQVRGGLAKPASSIAEHYKQVLSECIPPCLVETDNPELAFMLSYGTTHHTTRIITDIKQKSTRIEVRCLDSLPVDLAMQALVFCLGVFETLDDTHLPNYDETLDNFESVLVYGLSAETQVKGNRMTMQEYALRIINESKNGLEKSGLSELIPKYLTPLENFVKNGINRADITRAKIAEFEKGGMDRNGALLAYINEIAKNKKE